MKSPIIAAILALSLAACTQAQVDTARDYQKKIAAACKVAIDLSADSPTLSPWVVRACGTEAAIAKLALDPSSLEWIADLIKKMRG